MPEMAEKFTIQEKVNICLSHRYATYSLSLLALTGGFLAPVLLYIGENQPRMLFGYILLLDLETLFLLRFRQ
jgi:uncharacterized membrane protein